jgi:TonB family protein
MNRGVTWEGWTLAEEADRRFRLILFSVSAPIFVCTTWLGLLQFEAQKTKQGVIEGRRIVELTVAQTEITPTPPPPTNPPADAITSAPQKPSAAPKLPEHPKQFFSKPEGQDRESAPSILIVKRGQLDNGNQHPNLITSRQPLVAVANPPKADLASIQPPSASGYGNGAPANTLNPGSAFAGQVDGAGQPLPDPPLDQPRDIQEVQQVFGRNGASLNAIYVRRAGGNLDMGDGKIVIRFTVAPNGTITDCAIVSSTFRDTVFENRIVAQIRLFRFPPKRVPVFVSPHYAIEFHGA